MAGWPMHYPQCETREASCWQEKGGGVPQAYPGGSTRHPLPATRTLRLSGHHVTVTPASLRPRHVRIVTSSSRPHNTLRIVTSPALRLPSPGVAGARRAWRERALWRGWGWGQEGGARAREKIAAVSAASG